MVGIKVTISGEKVQDVGYRLFLFEKIKELGIKRFFAKNVDKELIVYVGDKNEDRVKKFVECIEREYPKYSKKVIVGRSEKYPEKDIMLANDYFQVLTARQLYKGVDIIKEGFERLPERMAEALKKVL